MRTQLALFREMLINIVLVMSTVLTLSMSGCSTNPATGKRQLSLVSESQEIQMGQESDKQIISSLGLYPDSGLQRYIQQLGLSMARKSERPDLPWTFRVVDDPIVNAFALPGGFIYITRGIMAHIENEAELAGVVGHEIGHVTARHSAQQMSQQQLAQIGLVAGMIIKPELQEYAQVAGAGLGLLFLKFGRDHEREADDLGLRYMRRATFDPRQMPGVFDMLSRVSQAAGGEGRIPEWLSTHPNPENRSQRIKEQIDTIKSFSSGLKVGKEEHLRRLDGMVFGQNPREGYFRGSTFYQPDLKFRFDFPTGWQTINQKQAVIGVSQNQDAMVQITLSQQKSPEAAAREFFSQQGLQVIEAPRMGAIHGLSAASGQFAAQTEQGALAGRATFISHDGNVYQILGYTGQQQWASYRAAIGGAIESFDKLTDSKALNVQPQRLKIVKLTTASTLDEIIRKYSSPASVETLALINQVDKGARIPAGETVKVVTGEKFD